MALPVPEYEYGETLLKVEDVSVRLGGNQVLRDMNLEVRDLKRPGRVTGQVAGILGPSGVGKTRFFRVVAGLDAPERGKVSIGPRLHPVERGQVGVVAQDYPLFSHRSVLSNLMVAGGRAGLGGKECEGRAFSFLKRFGLEECASHYPVELSGGQRQRVAIIQQFMCSEHLILMDEPFSGLDPLAVQAVSELIHEVANLDELNTILVVTHDIAAAVAVADTLYLLGRDRDEKGRVVPGAKIQETYNLIERGLAWRKGIESTPEFVDLVREIVARFPSL